MKASLTSGLTVVGCTLVIGAAVGVAAAFAVVGLVTPEVLETPDDLVTIPVTMQEFDDPRAIEVAVELLPPEPITVSRAGTVTKWACAPGEKLASGESSVGVDGVGLLNLSTSVPLWRDVLPGDTGADVRALEEELVRLDQPADADSFFSHDEMRALTGIAAKAGVTLEGALTRDLVVWLPAPSVTVETCTRPLGAPVAPGDALADVSAGIVLPPVVLPDDRVPGPRLLDMLPKPVALSEGGELPSGVTADDIRATDAFQEAVSVSPGETSLVLKGRAVLQTPVDVAAIPATAILVEASGGACVFVDGTSLTVTVVGSEFGTSFVVFPASEHPVAVDASPGSRSSCT